jgi:hypothetical protein
MAFYNRKFFWIIFWFAPVLIFSGCSGGGSTAPSEVSSKPEEAVMQILDQWRVSESPMFRFTESGTIQTSDTQESERGFITFKDLSGETWQLLFEKVEYVSSSEALVYTGYYSSGAPQFGGLKIIFRMIKDVDVWMLDGLEVIEIPAVVITETGINGVVTDKVTGLPVSNVAVEAYNVADDHLVGYDVSDSGGYYEILNISSGEYYLVFTREGYESWTVSGIQVNQEVEE